MHKGRPLRRFFRRQGCKQIRQLFGYLCESFTWCHRYSPDAANYFRAGFGVSVSLVRGALMYLLASRGAPSVAANRQPIRVNYS